MTTETQTMPTALYWREKKEMEPIVLPFQTIETINESRATREKEKKPGPGPDGKINTGSVPVFPKSSFPGRIDAI